MTPDVPVKYFKSIHNGFDGEDRVTQGRSCAQPFPRVRPTSTATPPLHPQSTRHPVPLLRGMATFTHSQVQYAARPRVREHVPRHLRQEAAPALDCYS